jgi:hypothetical protein
VADKQVIEIRKKCPIGALRGRLLDQGCLACNHRVDSHTTEGFCDTCHIIERIEKLSSPADAQLAPASQEGLDPT